MSTELVVKYEWQGKEIKLSRSIVRNRIATSKNVTDEEIDDYMDLCVYRQLNPFLNEAYLIKYGQEKAQIITSKDVFDLRASLDPNFDGEEMTNNYKRGMNLMDLWVRTKIFKKGCSRPVADVTVHYPEYVGKKKDGTIKFIWRTKPVTMLTKVSKAQGKREANPKDMTRLYLAEEFDQEAKPTESVIREVDITPKSKHEGEVIPMNDARDNAENVKGAEIEEKVDRDDEAIEEVEVIEEEGSLDKLSFDEMKEKYHDEDEAALKSKDTPKKQVEMEGEPASDKQKDYIYGGATNKGIVDSHLITKAEVKRIGKAKDLSKEKASKVMNWWWGDKDKNIVGEREKREKNPVEKPKTGKNDLERRKQLMHEVLALFNKNFLHKPMQKKFYKKYQKSDIKELAYEELVELKGELEHYVPKDW